MTSVATSRPLRKDAARNRELLLAAGREVFAERGLEASLDDVAHRAGLGVGTAYRHFANKYELARAIFAQAVEDIVDLAHRCAAAPDPWQGIVGFLEGAAAVQTTDRGLREVLSGVHDPEDLDAINARVAGPLGELVARAKAAGVLRPCVEATDLGLVVLMLCTVTDVAGDIAPQLWRRYLALLLDGLRGGPDIDEPAISADELRTAMGTHHQRLARRGGPQASGR
ncbi:MAG TPA: helix-turn-helix domain-containing protein [Jatrophihabitans sp.]|nr:helix-turn-helix domain-containing protein [Jatrophihabitans sp.]